MATRVEGSSVVPGKVAAGGREGELACKVAAERLGAHHWKEHSPPSGVSSVQLAYFLPAFPFALLMQTWTGTITLWSRQKNHRELTISNMVLLGKLIWWEGQVTVR